MRSRLALLALLAVGLGLIGWAVFARETDEEAIRRRLEVIAAAVAIVPEEGVVPRALRVKEGLEESVAKDARVAIPELREQLDRESLVGAAVQAGQRWSSGRVTYRDVRIEKRGEDVAHVRATAVLDGTSGGAPRSDERPITVDLREVDGEWIVTGIEVEPETEAGEEAGGW